VTPRILLTGGSGLLGTALRAAEPGIVAPGHGELDVCDREGFAAALRAHRPGIVIHAAALVGTAICDREPARCLDVNVGGTINVVLAARAVSARLIFLSTDYVFDGTVGGYRETDPTSPINLYGRSKVAAEAIVLSLDDALVLRTSFCSSTAWKFAGAFTDQYSSRDTVERISAQVLLAARSPLAGILHMGAERRSLYDLARTIDPAVKPLSITSSPLRLPRDVSLDVSRWRAHRKGSP